MNEIRKDYTLEEFEQFLDSHEEVKKFWHPTERDARDGRLGRECWFIIKYYPETSLWDLDVGSASGNYAWGDKQIRNVSKEECLDLYKEWFRC